MTKNQRIVLDYLASRNSGKASTGTLVSRASTADWPMASVRSVVAGLARKGWVQETWQAFVNETQWTITDEGRAALAKPAPEVKCPGGGKLAYSRYYKPEDRFVTMCSFCGTEVETAGNGGARSHAARLGAHPTSHQAKNREV